MSTSTVTIFKRLGLGLAIAGLTAGAAAFAADDAGSPAASDPSATAAPGDQSDQGPGPGRPGPGRFGRSGSGAGFRGPGPGGNAHRGMMGRRGFHGPMRGHGSLALRMDMRLLGAMRQLQLTPAQHDQLRTVVFDAMQTARRARFETRLQAEQAQRDNASVLSNPGDPNYARAVQQLKSRALDRVQQSIQLATDTEQKLYNVLTTEQKAQLPKVLSDMAARRQQRMAMRMRPHGGPENGQPGHPGGPPQQ